MLLPPALAARTLGPTDPTAACASALRSDSRRLGSSDRAQGFAPETEKPSATGATAAPCGPCTGSCTWPVAMADRAER